MEKKLNATKNDTSQDRHSNGVLATKLAVLQSRFIASLSNIEIPDMDVKLNFDSVDRYIEVLQDRILKNPVDNSSLIKNVKASLADFKVWGILPLSMMCIDAYLILPRSESL